MRGHKATQATLFAGQSAVVAAAAHELKNPLTIINYIAQILSDDTLPLTNKERLEYLERLQLVSKRSLRLVQQLTTSYRLQDQLAFQFKLEPVNVREVCESALHELAPFAKQYGQQLQYNSARPRVVVANRDVMYDVVVNLVDNAIKHNRAGKRVQVTSRSHGTHVRLSVHDDGAATIQQSELNKLRAHIGREPQPFTGHAGTSGLGLYIASQLAGAMGGSLGLGRARQGTTFFVDFLRSKQLSLW
jgi:two-component system phosphate regulon sensor histidine kinase PhoR